MATVYTQAGEEEVTDFTTGSRNAPANYYIAWGTDGTTAVKGDTALGSEGAESRATAEVGEGSAVDIFESVGTLTAESDQSIAEAGLFTETSAGTMLIRGDFGALDIKTNDKVGFTITLEQT